jgi:hypothetical protein
MAGLGGVNWGRYGSDHEVSDNERFCAVLCPMGGHPMYGVGYPKGIQGGRKTDAGHNPIVWTLERREVSAGRTFWPAWGCPPAGSKRVGHGGPWRSWGVSGHPLPYTRGLRG